jgi:hypothetical protein
MASQAPVDSPSKVSEIQPSDAVNPNEQCASSHPPLVALHALVTADAFFTAPPSIVEQRVLQLFRVLLTHPGLHIGRSARGTPTEAVAALCDVAVQRCCALALQAATSVFGSATAGKDTRRHSVNRTTRTQWSAFSDLAIAVAGLPSRASENVGHRLRRQHRVLLVALHAAAAAVTQSGTVDEQRHSILHASVAPLLADLVYHEVSFSSDVVRAGIASWQHVAWAVTTAAGEARTPRDTSLAPSAAATSLLDALVARLQASLQDVGDGETSLEARHIMVWNYATSVFGTVCGMAAKDVAAYMLASPVHPQQRLDSGTETEPSLVHFFCRREMHAALRSLMVLSGFTERVTASRNPDAAHLRRQRLVTAAAHRPSLVGQETLSVLGLAVRNGDVTTTRLLLAALGVSPWRGCPVLEDHAEDSSWQHEKKKRAAAPFLSPPLTHVVALVLDARGVQPSPTSEDEQRGHQNDGAVRAVLRHPQSFDLCLLDSVAEPPPYAPPDPRHASAKKAAGALHVNFKEDLEADDEGGQHPPDSTDGGSSDVSTWTSVSARDLKRRLAATAKPGATSVPVPTKPPRQPAEGAHVKPPSVADVLSDAHALVIAATLQRGGSVLRTALTGGADAGAALTAGGALALASIFLTALNAATTELTADRCRLLLHAVVASITGAALDPAAPLDTLEAAMKMAVDLLPAAAPAPVAIASLMEELRDAQQLRRQLQAGSSSVDPARETDNATLRDSFALAENRSIICSDADLVNDDYPASSPWFSEAARAHSISWDVDELMKAADANVAAVPSACDADDVTIQIDGVDRVAVRVWFVANTTRKRGEEQQQAVTAARSVGAMPLWMLLPPEPHGQSAPHATLGIVLDASVSAGTGLMANSLVVFTPAAVYGRRAAVAIVSPAQGRTVAVPALFSSAVGIHTREARSTRDAPAPRPNSLASVDAPLQDTWGSSKPWWTIFSPTANDSVGVDDGRRASQVESPVRTHATAGTIVAPPLIVASHHGMDGVVWIRCEAAGHRGAPLLRSGGQSLLQLLDRTEPTTTTVQQLLRDLAGGPLRALWLAATVFCDGAYTWTRRNA